MDDSANTDLSPTQRISEYIVRSSYDDLPGEVINKAKMCILDSLGCVTGGSTLEPGEIVLDLLTEMQGKPESTIIPKGPKVPTIHAAYVNSSLANLVEFDDVGRGHAGSGTVPPALAVAEKVGASGRELIKAVVLAYEVNARIADAIKPSPQRDKQVRGMGTHLTFAAATAASALLHLDAETTAIAFGLAGTNASLPSIWKMLEARPKSWLKFNVGWASMGGVLAALLAERGFIGNQAILDGDKGFWVMAGSDQCNFEEMTKELGQEYRILEVISKPYPCGRVLHSSIDATRQILTEHDVHPGSVEKVHVKSISMLKGFMDYAPMNCIDAEFSLPYVIAMALLDKPPGSQWLSEATLRDPEVLAIAQKVAFEFDPEAERIFYEKNWQEFPVTVTLLAGGKEFEASVSHPKNLTGVEVEQKFRQLSIPVLGASVTEEVIIAVRQLEDLTRVTSLMQLFHH